MDILSKQVQLKWLFEVSVNREICVVILTVFKGLYDFGQERFFDLLLQHSTFDYFATEWHIILLQIAMMRCSGWILGKANGVPLIAKGPKQVCSIALQLLEGRGHRRRQMGWEVVEGMVRWVKPPLLYACSVANTLPQAGRRLWNEK
ncbi:hypothetical protein MUK42_23914 [Musa troglodytarum]|uniref:Uncharacterized protein n=1 Tax=Musa troglodytarum TaxID=320322 RepID=A0A9E7G4T3_9LILI|nr:hypothetical protein MUK42_23914 [Musa troglodytarum]